MRPVFIWNKVKTPTIALVSGVMCALLLLVLSAENPLAAVASFFLGPFSAPFYIGSWLNSATLLVFASLGMVISLQSGNVNLGGEGQVYAGGFVACIVLNALRNLPPIVALFAAMLCAMSVSGLLALFSGLLKAKRNISELLTSFLVSSAVIPLIDYSVCGPLRDKSGTLLALPFIKETFRLKSIMPPSKLNASIVVAVLLCGIASFFLYKTKSGYRLCICGKASEFARYCGFSLQKTTVAALAASGALHGLSGFFAVCGTYYTCHNGFYAGMGWNALSVSLMAKTNPRAVFPSALLMAYLLTAADRAVLVNNLKFDAASLIQAVVLLTISAQFMYAESKKRARA